MRNKMWLLVNRPSGEPNTSDFQLVERPVPELRDGEILVRNHFLSLDPYMRLRMNDAKSYAPPQPLDQVMVGGTAGVVSQSKSAKFSIGDTVAVSGGWQEFTVLDTNQPINLRKVDASRLPLSAFLGAVGMPGVTAWMGLRQIIEPKAGQTIVISAASGAVGSVAGQLAKRSGSRVVGIAGGAEKCRYVLNDLGFDACIDYKAAKNLAALEDALIGACPSGIDGYFENVGGQTLQAVMQCANDFARIAVCGMISEYNGETNDLRNPRLILTKRLKLQGFIVSDQMQLWPKALTELADLAANGGLRFRESVAQGIEEAPRAFIGMLKGKNFGKQLVKLI
jgi:NADPH-dependent curcumin reductase